MGAAPDWDRLLELPRTGLGEPHHPSTQIALDDRDLETGLDGPIDLVATSGVRRLRDSVD